MAFSPICLVAGHSVKRSRVKFDGRYFRGHCRRCDVSMIRLPNGWERDRNQVVDA